MPGIEEEAARMAALAAAAQQMHKTNRLAMGVLAWHLSHVAANEAVNKVRPVHSTVPCVRRRDGGAPGRRCRTAILPSCSAQR